MPSHANGFRDGKSTPGRAAFAERTPRAIPYNFEEEKKGRSACFADEIRRTDGVR